MVDKLNHYKGATRLSFSTLTTESDTEIDEDLKFTRNAGAKTKNHEIIKKLNK